MRQSHHENRGGSNILSTLVRVNLTNFISCYQIFPPTFLVQIELVRILEIQLASYRISGQSFMALEIVILDSWILRIMRIAEPDCRLQRNCHSLIMEITMLLFCH